MIHYILLQRFQMIILVTYLVWRGKMVDRHLGAQAITYNSVN